MKTVCFTALLIALSSAVASANDPAGCDWNGKTVPAGESVYVEDPQLVREYVAFYVDRGASRDVAVRRAKSADWVGFVLECVTVFTPSNDVSAPGGVIKPTNYALVLIDHQREWYGEILKSR